MSNPKLWVLILALISFSIGAAAATWVAAHSFRPPPERGPFAEYERGLVDTFALSPDRARLLHVVLANYQQEVEQIKDRHSADFMSAMEPELSARGRYYRDVIQGKVLPEHQRSKFDALAQGVPWPSAQ